MSWEEAALCRTGARPETLTQLSPCCVTLGYVFYFSKLEFSIIKCKLHLLLRLETIEKQNRKRMKSSI